MEETWPCHLILPCCFFIMSYHNMLMDPKEMMGCVSKILFTHLDYLLPNPYNLCLVL
jgi:hypothetical protein